MKKTLKERALEISNRFPFSQVPPPTDEQGNIIIVKSDLDKDFMERLERGDHLDEEFMKRLEKGDDLDTDEFPL